MRFRKLGQLPLLPWAIAVGLSATAAAQVSGKLVLGAYKPTQAQSKRPAYNWELENGFKEVRPDRVDVRREVAVVLIGEGEAKGLDRVEVPITGGSLLPSTLVVRTGTTILFRNDDEIAHELYAPGLAGFAAEATAPRGRRSVNLTQAGAWPLRDMLVSHVAGYLYVLPDVVAVAALDADGQFTFKDVQPGKYVLKAFHGETELSSQAIELGPRPLTVNLVALTGSQGAK
jgi:hypothetical protein